MALPSSVQPYQDDGTAMNWRIDPARDTPPWRQLVDLVLDRVAAGNLGAGEQLLSVRAMAAQAMVNHNTVARAYRDLEQQGVVQGQNGRGVFVQAEGPGRARALCRGMTMQAFSLAMEEALRSGHSIDDLFDALSHLRKHSA